MTILRGNDGSNAWVENPPYILDSRFRGNDKQSGVSAGRGVRAGMTQRQGVAGFLHSGPRRGLPVGMTKDRGGRPGGLARTSGGAPA
jgi:hypothetical protein